MPNWNNMLSLKRLQCFVVLVETKSFTQTAQQLHLTQPTVTKYLQQLEDELHLTLFIKSEGIKKRQIHLSEIGERIYQHAQIVLKASQNLQQDVLNYQNQHIGTLKLGVPPLGAQLLTTALFDFHQHLPNIEFSFLEVGSKAIEEALLNHQLDVGVLLEPINTQIFNRIELCNYPLMVVLRRDAVWANRSHIALSELSNQSFLMFQETFSLNDVILNACKMAGFTPNIVCRTSQWHLLADMVYQRMGVALLPQYYTDMLNPIKFCAIPLVDPELRWHLSMAWKKNILPTPAVNAWINIIHQQF